MSGTAVAVFDVPEPNILNDQTDWSIDFRQIDPGPMNTTVRVRASERVSLIDISMSRGVHQYGYSPNRATTFGLPTRTSRLTSNGKDVDGSYLVDFGSEQEFDFASGGGFSALTVSISRRYLVRLCDRTGLPDPEDIQRRTSTPIRLLSGEHAALPDSARDLVYEPCLPFGEAEQEELAIRLVLANSAGEEFEDRSTVSARAKSIRRAVAYIYERACDDLRVSEICAVAKVSWRTLDRAFKEHYGVGPKAYLNRLRLVRIRSDLLRRRPGASVADAANAWGFWHLGQFARDYFKMFGERPSDTLRKSD